MTESTLPCFPYYTAFYTTISPRMIVWCNYVPDQAYLSGNHSQSPVHRPAVTGIGGSYHTVIQNGYMLLCYTSAHAPCCMASPCLCYTELEFHRQDPPYVGPVLHRYLCLSCVFLVMFLVIFIVYLGNRLHRDH